MVAFGELSVAIPPGTELTRSLVSVAMQTKQDPSLLKVVEDYHHRATATGAWIDWSTSFDF